MTRSRRRAWHATRSAERDVERNENTSIWSGVTDTNAISSECNQGTFDGGVQSEQSSQNAMRGIA